MEMTLCRHIVQAEVTTIRGGLFLSPEFQQHVAWGFSPLSSGGCCIRILRSFKSETLTDLRAHKAAVWSLFGFLSEREAGV